MAEEISILTQVNLKVKIYHVDRLFVGTEFKTQVWATHEVMQALNDFRRVNKDGILFNKKLHYMATKGFRSFLGGAIRPEGDGVFRIGHDRTLFRVIGFFDDTAPNTESFFMVDSFLKPGQKLSLSQRAKIDQAALAKRKNYVRKTNQ